MKNLLTTKEVENFKTDGAIVLRKKFDVSWIEKLKRGIKKDIKYLHTSNDGHKVYSFKYKGGDTKYSGVMAQDVLKINPNAVVLKNGILAVYYDMIDVNMQQLDIIQ